MKNAQTSFRYPSITKSDSYLAFCSSSKELSIGTIIICNCITARYKVDIKLIPEQKHFTASSRKGWQNVNTQSNGRKCEFEGSKEKLLYFNDIIVLPGIFPPGATVLKLTKPFFIVKVSHLLLGILPVLLSPRLPFVLFFCLGV